MKRDIDCDHDFSDELVIQQTRIRITHKGLQHSLTIKRNELCSRLINAEEAVQRLPRDKQNNIR